MWITIVVGLWLQFAMLLASLRNCLKSEEQGYSERHLSKMVDMFEPNSVASQHLEQLHQKFLVIARWSRLAESGMMEEWYLGYLVNKQESESLYSASFVVRYNVGWTLRWFPRERECTWWRGVLPQRCLVLPSPWSTIAHFISADNEDHERWSDKTW